MKFKRILVKVLGEGRPVAGNPEKHVFEVPTEIPVVAKGDPAKKPEDYDSVLETDASYFYEDHVEGQAWRLTIGGKAYKLKKKSRRYGQGPNVAEMKAIIDGLKEAKQKGSHYLLVKTDNRWCANILVGLWKAKKPYTIPIANEAIELVQGFEGVAVIRTSTKSIREVDIAAREAGRAKRIQAEAVKKKRIKDLKSAMERASDVRLEETEGGWRANGRFNVTVDPPSCTCQWWSLKWKDVPLAGKRARRLPCKHIIAAARKEGITEPGDLIALSQRAEE